MIRNGIGPYPSSTLMSEEQRGAGLPSLLQPSYLSAGLDDNPHLRRGIRTWRSGSANQQLSLQDTNRPKGPSASAHSLRQPLV